MEKEIALVVCVMCFVVLAINTYALDVDSKIEQELSNKPEVSVIIMLKDDYPADSRVSALSENRIESLEERMNSRKSMIKKQQDVVLSTLNLKESRSQRRMRLLGEEDYDFNLKGSYSVINGFSGNITKEGLEKLKKNRRIERIYYDNIKYLDLSTSVPQINADDVRPLMPNGTNITGLGQTICVIDTGIDYTHENLGNCSTTNFT